MKVIVININEPTENLFVGQLKKPVSILLETEFDFHIFRSLAGLNMSSANLLKNHEKIKTITEKEIVTDKLSMLYHKLCDTEHEVLP